MVFLFNKSVFQILMSITFFVLQSYSSEYENKENRIDHGPNILLDSSDEIENFVCSSFANFATWYLKCNFSLSFRKSELDVLCIKSKENHTIGVSIKRKTLLSQGTLNQFPHSLSCVSNTPLSVNTDFKDGNALPHFTDIKQEKQIQNYNNKSTYDYKLSILLPSGKKYLKFGEDKLIKYKITSNYYEELNSNILLEFQEDSTSRGYSLIEESVIEISTKEFLQIPVVSLRGKKFALHKTICRDAGGGKCIESIKDPLCIKFGDENGINYKSLNTLTDILNLWNVAHDQLIVLQSEQENLGQLKQYILLYANFSYRPLVVHNHVVKSNFDQHLKFMFSTVLKRYFDTSCSTQKSLSYEQLQYVLQLLKIPERVLGDEDTLSFDPFSGLRVHNRIFQMYGEGTYQVWIDEVQIISFRIRFNNFTATPNYGVVLLYIPHYSILKRSFEYSLTLNCSSSKPITMEADSDLKISYNNLTEVLDTYDASAIVDSSSNLRNSTPLLVTCESDEYGVKNWFIYRDDRNFNTWTFSYSVEQNGFICGSGPGSDLVMRQWKCNNHFECLIVAAKCLHKFTEMNPEQRAIQTKYCMRHIIELHGICQENERHDHCLFVDAAEKGLVQCYMPYSQPVSEYGHTLFFEDHYMYFRGLNDVLYYEKGMDEAPLLSAILRLSSLSSSAAFYDNGEYRFKCEAHSFFFDDGLQWFFKFDNGSEFQATSSVPGVISTVEKQNSTNSVVIMTILIKDISLREIICSAPVLGKDTWENDTFQLELLESIPPKIHSLSDEVQLIEGEKNQIISCHADGLPRPKVIWTSSNSKIELPLRVLEETTLLFPLYSSTFSGEYECTASNIAGNITKRIKVSGYYPLNSENIYIIPVVATVSCSAIFILMSLLYYFVDKKMKKYREMKQVINILNGRNISKTEAMENSCQPTVEMLQLPFDKKYEISKNTFIVDRNKILGKGEFGEVYRGLLEGVEAAVAFKTVRPNCGIAPLKALAAELKILMYIGPHENLVALLGAYRQEIKNGILYVALELCEFGSLESFLRKNKSSFLKCPILNPEHDYQNQRFSSEDNQAESLYSIQSILRWSLQIACAMEYLGTKKVIHSDLAARNVLLTSKGDAKVTDFGLSRRTYNYTEYVKTAKDPLPWRWLALESLKTNTFSSQSDVWAYGITLWEMFSLGDMPYPGLSPTAKFVQDLENGLRNFKPKDASDDMYGLMLRCWNAKPEHRPTFYSLKIVMGCAFSNETTNAYMRPESWDLYF